MHVRLGQGILALTPHPPATTTTPTTPIHHRPLITMSTADLTTASAAAYNVGRRLSGSSSKVSLRDEDMEMLDFNINDISRASSPASISAKSEGHLHRDRRQRHSFRGDEDYRRRYSKLKAELEVERAKVKAMNKDKIEEMRQIREFYEKERKQEHAAMEKRFEDEKKKELARMKEEVIKQKDYELQQVLKYKEDEIRLHRSHTPGSKTPMSERSRTPASARAHTPGFETPRTPRTRPHTPESKDGGGGGGMKTPSGTGRQTPGLDSITDEIVRAKTPSDRARTPGGGRMTPMLSREEDRLGLSLKESQARVQQMEEEVARLTKQRDEARAQYLSKCKAQERQEKEVARMKEEYEDELRRVIGEYKKVALGNLQKLKMAEQALRDGAMTEDDVLHIPLASPQNMQIRRGSVSSLASQEGGAAGTGTAGAESGDEGVSTLFLLHQHLHHLLRHHHHHHHLLVLLLLDRHHHHHHHHHHHYHHHHLLLLFLLLHHRCRRRRYHHHHYHLLLSAWVPLYCTDVCPSTTLLVFDRSSVLSVCLSVCPSTTLLVCVYMYRCTGVCPSTTLLVYVYIYHSTTDVFACVRIHVPLYCLSEYYGACLRMHTCITSCL